MTNDHSLDEGCVLIILPLPEKIVTDSIKWLQRRHPRLKVIYQQGFKPDSMEPFKLSAVWRECTILVTLSCYPPSLEAVPNLKLIHAPGAGIDHALDNPIFSTPRIRVTTSTGTASPAVSEWFIAQLLDHTRKFGRFRDFQRQQKWDQSMAELFSVRDLVGQRLGILGYGSIGRQSARIAHAMGMKVLAYTATPKTTPELRRDRSYIVEGTGDPDGSIPIKWYSGTDKESLMKFLSQRLDVVLVSLPLTEDTRGLLGAREFEVLKENSPHGCFLMNVSRGDVIVQDDLIEALEDESSGLSGAALDVTTPEPLPSDSPLWRAPRCTITPHMSAIQGRYVERVLQVLDANLRKAPGEKLINEMDGSRAY